MAVALGGLLGALLGGGLITGCGRADQAPAADRWSAPDSARTTARTTAQTTAQTTPEPTAQPSPPSTAVPAPGATGGPDTPPAAAVRLPWPAHDAAAAADLQRSVDGGSEPWLLDPAEVAVSYAGAAHGWSGAQAQPRPGGTVVDVADGSRRLTLTLHQPARSGPGGIWVVTAEAAG